ncbi:hypothetical protein I4U23_011366 [Adineta vaga]|nr:hypothetical protein I4U23_011366 [Adineta vaga]
MYIFFLLLSIGYSLICINYEQPYRIKMANLDLDELKKELNNLTTSKVAKDVLCSVELDISSDSPILTIQFNVDYILNKLSNREIQFETSIKAKETSGTKLTNTLTYISLFRKAMGHIHMITDDSLSPNDEQRLILFQLIFILGLGLCFVNFAIFGIIYYIFGFIVAYRHSNEGLRIFVIIGICAVILMSLSLALYFIISLNPSMNINKILSTYSILLILLIYIPCSILIVILRSFLPFRKSYHGYFTQNGCIRPQFNTFR